MKFLIAVISLLQLPCIFSGNVGWFPTGAGPDSCNRLSSDGCGNSCAAQEKSCCFCDQTRDFNLRACFCCPQNHFCCPSETWMGGAAHCCRNGYQCTRNGLCAVPDNIQGVIARGYTGFQCRNDQYCYASVDNSFSMYIDGKEVPLTNPNKWETPNTFSLPSNATVIVICAKNEQYKAGILISCLDPDLLRRARIKCVSSVEKCSGWWKDPRCNDDSWGDAVFDELNDGRSTRKDIVPNIPQDTPWFWCNRADSTNTKDWAPSCTCRITLPDRPFNGFN